MGAAALLYSRVPPRRHASARLPSAVHPGTGLRVPGPAPRFPGLPGPSPRSIVHGIAQGNCRAGRRSRQPCFRRADRRALPGTRGVHGPHPGSRFPAIRFAESPLAGVTGTLRCCVRAVARTPPSRMAPPEESADLSPVAVKMQSRRDADNPDGARQRSAGLRPASRRSAKPAPMARSYANLSAAPPPNPGGPGRSPLALPAAAPLLCRRGVWADPIIGVSPAGGRHRPPRRGRHRARPTPCMAPPGAEYSAPGWRRRLRRFQF